MKNEAVCHLPSTLQSISLSKLLSSDNMHSRVPTVMTSFVDIDKSTTCRVQNKRNDLDKVALTEFIQLVAQRSN